MSVAWARDGTRLAFSVTSIGGTAEFNGLHVVTLSTGRDFWSRVPSGDHGPENLEWSPDGSRLVYDASGSIYVLDVSTFRVTRLRTGAVEGAFDSNASWSPDGTRIAFATERSGTSRISVIDVDGSHRRLLATHGGAPAWSPDGRAIAYRASCGIKLVTPSGQDVTPRSGTNACTAIGVAGDPAWSPDGRKIAILHAHAFTPGTFVIDPRGRHLTLLTRATGATFSPAKRGDASWQPRRKI